MNKNSHTAPNVLRMKPLAACLAMAMAAGFAGDALAAEARTGLAPHTTTASRAHRHLDVSKARMIRRPAAFKTYLQQKVAKVHSKVPNKVSRPAATIAVTNCLDDGTAGNLRDAITSAATGDTIDLSALTCSTITLQTGVINIAVDDLTIKGAGPGAISIDGNNLDTAYGSIFFHGGYGVLTLQGLTLTNASYNGLFATGGAVFSSGSVTLANTTISNSQAYGYFGSGGAVFAAANLTVSNSNIIGNSVISTKYDGTGGGLYGATGLSISNSTISGNQARSTDYADYGYGKGGGVMSTVAATISGSTLSNNTADYGGAVAMLNGATPSTEPLVMSNSTLSGNSGNRLAGAVLAGFPLTVQNSTVAFNTGNTYGVGGLFLLGATELESTIVSNNLGTTAYYDVNVSGDPSVTISGANNLLLSSDLTPPAGTISVDPNLHPLANNGGTTQTHALAAGSSALNAGNNVAGLSFDQRGTGFPRSAGAAPDIGAYELAAAVVVAPTRPVPALSTWALGLMVAMFGLLGWRRQKIR